MNAITRHSRRTSHRCLTASVLFSMLIGAAIGAHRLINSDQFDIALVWWNGDTFRYWAATQALFERNRAEALGIEGDRADWRTADDDQDRAARRVPRWMQRHIDRHVLRGLGWDDRAGWTL